MWGWRRTSTPKMEASPASIGSRVASILSMVVLPAPLGPEHAEDLAATHLEVDRVDRALRPEGLDEPGGRNRQVGVRDTCHGRSIGRRGFTTPSCRFHDCPAPDATASVDRVVLHDRAQRLVDRAVAGDRHLGVVTAAPQPQVERRARRR